MTTALRSFAARLVLSLAVLVTLTVSPAQAAYTFITGDCANLGQNGGTSPTYNLATADLIVYAVSYDGSGAAPTTSELSASPALTWHQRTAVNSGGASVRVFYAYGNNIGNASHTITVTQTGVFASGCVAAFDAGAAITSDPFDDEDSGTISGTSVTSGTITVAENNEVVIAAFASIEQSSGVNFTNLTEIDEVNLSAGAAYALAMAYEIQTSATNRNETASTTFASSIAISIAGFKLSTGGGAPPAATGALLLLGAGGP